MRFLRVIIAHYRDTLRIKRLGEMVEFWARVGASDSGQPALYASTRRR